MPDLLKLNLGACDRRFPGFLSVDICPPADLIADLSGPWPWPDSSVSEVLAFDVFEHIGNCTHMSLTWCCPMCAPVRNFLPPVRAEKAKIHVMNELWRVLVPGGTATLQIPHATDGDGGHCDPTHVSYWTTSDFEYYVKGIAERERFRSSPYYAVKADFRVVNLTADAKIPTQRFARSFGGHVVEMRIVLEAIK